MCPYVSQAGLNSGYDTGYYTLPGSLSLGIANLANTSNVNFTGRWAFRVDQLHPKDANGNNIGRGKFYSVLSVRSNIYLLSSMI